MVEVIKIIATSFKKFYACSAALSAPDLAAGHLQSMPPLETLGHSQASLDQSLVGSLPFYSSPGVHKVLFVPSKSLFPQFFVSSCGSMLRLMENSSKWAYATARSAAPRASAPVVVHCRPIPPQEMLKHSKAGLAESLSLSFWQLLNGCCC